MKKGIGEHAIGDTFENFLLIKEVSKGVASNGKPFLSIIFRDQTGEIEAKLWDVTEEDESLYIPAQIVRISGKVNQFRGQTQLRIGTIRPSNYTDGVRVSDFIEKAPIDQDEIIDKLTETIF